MDKVSKNLVLPGREQLKALSYQIDRKDRGQTVLFSIWQRSSLGRKTPSDIRFEIEVDVQTRLPKHSRVYLDRGQQEWDLVNELNYRDYDVPLADELFEVADDAVRAAPKSVLKADPLGKALAPFGPLHNRVFFMPLEGMEIVVHPPSNDPTKGRQGMSGRVSGGVASYEFHRTPLTEIAQKLGDRPVETPDSVLSDQRYSVADCPPNQYGPRGAGEATWPALRFCCRFEGEAGNQDPLDLYSGWNRFSDQRYGERISEYQWVQL